MADNLKKTHTQWFHEIIITKMKNRLVVSRLGIREEGAVLKGVAWEKLMVSVQLCIWLWWGLHKTPRDNIT